MVEAKYSRVIQYFITMKNPNEWIEILKIIFIIIKYAIIYPAALISSSYVITMLYEHLRKAL